MDVLRITIGKARDDGWPVSVELQLSENLVKTSLQEVLILPAGYENHLRKLQIAYNPQEYGEYLGKSLFTDSLQDIFDSGRKGLHRVILSVEDDALRQLSWHWLCYPWDSGAWNFIAHDQHLPFSLGLVGPAEGSTKDLLAARPA